jgi:hypothetical protein
MFYLKRIKPIILLLFFFIPGIKSFSQKRHVDVVFCMDLSGSTNGLIDDFRDRLWDMALQFRSVSPAPSLRIGVVGYSRPSYGKASGYAKVLSPLTADLDQLSFDLFEIKPYIEKGDQLVGAALQMAVKNMDWSKDANAIKMIFIVGNGGVEFGPVDFRTACSEALLKNIIVHPVFCSKANKSKEITGWLEIARLCGTEIKEIYIHKKLELDAYCPDITALHESNDRFNRTYVYFGEQGYNMLKLLKEADAAAFHCGLLCFESRMYYKAKYLSGQHDWDLVDYLKNKGDLPLFDHSTLADSLKMVPDENLKKMVLKTGEQRMLIEAELGSLMPAGRAAFIKNQLVSKSMEHAESLDMMVTEAYFKTLGTLGFNFE